MRLLVSLAFNNITNGFWISAAKNIFYLFASVLWHLQIKLASSLVSFLAYYMHFYAVL